MPRSTTFDAVILEAISPVVARIAASIARKVGATVAKELDAALRQRSSASRARPAARRRARGRVELTRWVADRRARRVPNFVIELTGLDTKKKIVAKFGADAAFAKGKPLPPEARAEPKREIKAKGPTIRKKAAAAA